ncbi:DUF3418 domain-containing protein [Nocardioides sp. W3-2-3]|nr:DUF3418 domain-containing protein [Nocardioides convexus]
MRTTLAESAAGARRVARGRAAAERSRRPAAAAGAHRPAGPDSGGWCTTASSVRRAPPGCAATAPTCTRCASVVPRWGPAARPRSPRTGSGSTSLQPLQDAYLDRVAALPQGRPPGAGLRAIRWMLEEYRVSLWAQRTGVDGPVSDVRLRKAFDGLA